MTETAFGLQGKGALVLGGGQGMGEATAMALARAGCRVAVFDYELERADRIVAQIEAEGGSAFSLHGDALDDSVLRTAIADADVKLGGIDVMASIIGMAAWSPLVEMATETWDLDHRRNLRYVFVAAQAVAQHMIDRGRGGAMVCIGSVDGIRSAPYHGAYGAAKAGLIHLVKTMAFEWASSGIRVNCVTPGSIVSPRIPLREPMLEREMVTGIPMGERGSAEDIAKAALFFLSDLARYVSGQNLAIDGGLLTGPLFDYGRPMSETGKGGTIGMPN
jgi:NAD(P)-dependent dehydrogenase (short-subunit alcohol dehydrogenase family)